VARGNIIDEADALDADPPDIGPPDGEPVDVPVAVAGVGDVAMVAGAPQAAMANEKTMNDDDNDFMGNP
jgi:hypothetical protein